MIFIKEKNRGFTLIELMVAMVIGLIVMASIFQVFRTYQKAQTTQQLVVDMLQNARAAMTLMKREIRMAGYAPAAKDGVDNDGDGNIDDADPSEIGPGFVKAQRGLINFTMDILPDNPADCSDGVDNDSPADGLIDELDECYDGDTNDANEDITYDLSGTTLRRITSDGTADLAYDIEAVAFAYAFDSDFDGLLDTDTGAIDGNVIWAYDSWGMGVSLDRNAETGAALATPVPMKTAGGRSIIGAVKIWLLARTANPVPNYSDTQTYQLADQTIGPGTYDQTYKRTLLTATVYCRNLRF